MSAGFTPGPWEYRRGDSRVTLRSIAGNGVNRSEIARVLSLYGDTRQAAEAEANARLIASAPELYEAARLFVEEYDAADQEDGVAMMLAYNAALETARAALAKARGES